jgi:hypothetical protein
MKVLFIVTLYILQLFFTKHGHYLHAKAQNLNGNLVTIPLESLGTSNGEQL